MSEFYHDPLAPIQPDQLAIEFGRLLELYQSLKPRRVLEIGVREGGTLYQWIKHATPGAQIVAVDKPGGPWGIAEEPDDDAWMKWADARGVNLRVIFGDSHYPRIALWVEKDAPFDFVFIDGDHSFGGIACDFLAYSRMVRPGGVIAIHDILRNADDDRIEVWRYWQEIRLISAYRPQELIGAPDQRTRGIGVVYV